MCVCVFESVVSEFKKFGVIGPLFREIARLLVYDVLHKPGSLSTMF